MKKTSEFINNSNIVMIIFIILFFLFASVFNALLAIGLPLSIFAILCYVGMGLTERHPVKFGGKPNFQLFKTLFKGLIYTFSFIIKSMYFHLHKRPIFIYNLFILSIPIVGVFFDWNANDFVLVTLLNLIANFICLWIIAVFGFEKKIKSRIIQFFGYAFVLFFFFIFLPLIGLREFVPEGPSGLFTITLKQGLYILLCEVIIQFIPFILNYFRKKNKNTHHDNAGRIFIGYLLLIPAATIIIPFCSNFPDIYSNYKLLSDVLLCIILITFISLSDNFSFLPVFHTPKKGKEKRDNWFKEFDDFYEN